jgi:hypothetical protein
VVALEEVDEVETVLVWVDLVARDELVLVTFVGVVVNVLLDEELGGPFPDPDGHAITAADATSNRITAVATPVSFEMARLVAMDRNLHQSRG